jgi:hypothetical protein
MNIPTSYLIGIMISWGILGTIMGFWFLSDGKAVLKKKLWPVLNILNGAILFMICIVTCREQWLLIGVCLLFIVPLMIRYVCFCTRCNRTTYCQHLIKWPVVCDHCGAAFNKRPLRSN